jgi:hypothetical protein
MSKDTSQTGQITRRLDAPSLSQWLRGEVTLTVARWTLLAGGLAAAILLIIALD